MFIVREYVVKTAPIAVQGTKNVTHENSKASETETLPRISLVTLQFGLILRMNFLEKGHK